MRGVGSQESPIDIDDSEEEILQELCDSTTHNSEPRRDNSPSPQHTLSMKQMALGGVTVTDQSSKGPAEARWFNLFDIQAP